MPPSGFFIGPVYIRFYGILIMLGANDVDQAIELLSSAPYEVANACEALNNARVDNYVNNLGRRLAANAPGEKFPYRFKVVNDRAIGVLGIDFAEPKGFEPPEDSFILALAHQCAQALERARLYEAQQRLRVDAERTAALLDTRAIEEYRAGRACHPLRHHGDALQYLFQFESRGEAEDNLLQRLEPGRLHLLGNQLGR